MICGNSDHESNCRSPEQRHLPTQRGSSQRVIDLVETGLPKVRQRVTKGHLDGGEIMSACLPYDGR